MDEQRLNQVRAVLFDLDGTLLQVEMEQFIPAYIAKLATHFDDRVERCVFAEVVRSATFSLIRSEEVRRSNEEFFLGVTERHLGVDGALFAERLQRFCADGLADLAGLIRPLPLARDILGRCFERGLRVVIATNPVFPRPVVEARLRWGGLDDFPYELVTTLENSRCCKPHPGYFRDLLDRLELPAEQTVMVGNDTEHDLAAAEAGIATFLVDTWLVDRCRGRFRADFRGDHRELLQFVETLGPSA